MSNKRKLTIALPPEGDPFVGLPDPLDPLDPLAAADDFFTTTKKTGRKTARKISTTAATETNNQVNFLGRFFSSCKSAGRSPNTSALFPASNVGTMAEASGWDSFDAPRSFVPNADNDERSDMTKGTGGWSVVLSD